MRYASRRPGEVLRDPRFLLLREPAIAGLAVGWGATLALLVISGILPLDALAQSSTIDARWMSAVLQVAVLTLGLAGVWRFARLMARIAVERDFALAVQQRGDEEVRRIRARRTEPISIDNVPQLWPQSQVRLEALSLCEEIYVDGLDRQFAARELLIDNARYKVLAWSAELGGLRRTSMHVGLLGTFVGLALATPELVKLGRGTFDETAFHSLFEALGSCFATSVTGLVVSLLVAAAAWHASRRSSQLVSRMEAAARTTGVVVRNAINRNASARTLDEVGRALDELTKRMEKQNERIDVQTGAIASGMERLHVARETLDVFLDSVSDIRERVVAESQRILERFDPGVYEDGLHQRLAIVGSTLADCVAAGVNGGMKALADSAQALGAASAALHESRGSLGAGTQALAAQADLVRAEKNAVERELQQLTSRLAEAFQDSLGGVVESLEQHSAEAMRLLASIEREKGDFLAAQGRSVHDLGGAVENVVARLQEQLGTVVEQQRLFLDELRSSQLSAKVVAAFESAHLELRRTIERGFVDFNLRIDKVLTRALRQRVRSWVLGLRGWIRAPRRGQTKS